MIGRKAVLVLEVCVSTKQLSLGCARISVMSVVLAELCSWLVIVPGCIVGWQDRLVRLWPCPEQICMCIRLCSIVHQILLVFRIYHGLVKQ